MDPASHTHIIDAVCITTLYIILSSSGTGKVDLLNFSFVLDSEDQRVQQENVRSFSHLIYIFKKDI